MASGRIGEIAAPTTTSEPSGAGLAHGRHDSEQAFEGRSHIYYLYGLYLSSISSSPARRRPPPSPSVSSSPAGPPLTQSGFPIPGPPCAVFLLALLAVPKRAPALEFPDGGQVLAWTARSLTAATGAHEEFCDLVVGGSPISVHPYIRTLHIINLAYMYM